MNRFARFFLASALAAAGSTAFAQSQPAVMTDDQMDNVTAGLIDVMVVNTLNDWSISLDLKLQANVAANVNAGVSLVGMASASQLIGTQTQITGNLQ
jgi:hypothetical protein